MILGKDSTVALPRFYQNFFQMILACFTEVLHQ